MPSWLVPSKYEIITELVQKMDLLFYIFLIIFSFNINFQDGNQQLGFTLGVPTNQRSTRSVNSWGVQCDCSSSEENVDVKTILLIIVIVFQAIILLKLFLPSVFKCMKSISSFTNRRSDLESQLPTNSAATLDSRAAQIL